MGDYDFRPKIDFPINAFQGIPSRWGGALSSLTQGIEKGQTAADLLRKKKMTEEAWGSLVQKYANDPQMAGIIQLGQQDPDIRDKIIPKLIESEFENKKPHTRTYQSMNFLDAQGRPIIGRFDSASGEPELKDPQTNAWKPAPAGSIRGFSPHFATDPVSGGMIRADSSGNAYPVGSPGFGGINKADPQNALLTLRQTSPKLADRFDQILDEASPDKNQGLKKSLDGASAAIQVKSILKDPNPSQTGLQSLGFQFAIMSGSNSQLSDSERLAFSEPLSLIDKVVNKGYKLTGNLSPKMRIDLLKLAETLERKSKSQAKRIIDTQKRKARSSMGRFYTPGLDASFPSLEELSVSSEDMLGQGSGSNSPSNSRLSVSGFTVTK